MTRKKTFTDRAIAFVAAMVFSMTLLLVFPAGTFNVFADYDFSGAIVVDGDNMDIDATICINNNPLTENTKLSNGDLLSLKVVWSIPEDYTNVRGTFVYDLSDKLQGIALQNQDVPANDATYHIRDNKLYIVLHEGQSGRSGHFSLNGKVDVTEDETSSNGGVNLEFIGTTETTRVPIIVNNYIASLGTQKTAVGNLTYNEVDGNYYQDFSITLTSSNNKSTNVKITDTGSDIFDFSNMTNLKVNGVDATPTTNSGTGFTLDIGTVEKDNPVTITYTVPVDPTNYIEGVSGNGNTVTPTADYQTPYSSTAYVTIQKPSVAKTHSYTDGDESITWTITVDPGFVGEAGFTVTESAGQNLTDEQILAGLAAVDPTITSLAIDKSKFVATNDGKYTFTFTTALTDAQKTPASTMWVTNNVSAKFDGVDNPYNANDTVTLNAQVTDFVTKTVGEQADDGTIPWTITIDVPDRNVSQIQVYDSITSSGEAFTADMITISGVGGDKTIDEIGSLGYANNTQINFYITNTAFIDANKGKTITITYSLKPDASKSSVTNTATATLTIDGTWPYDSDSATFELPSTVDYTASKILAPDAYHFLNENTGKSLEGKEYYVIWAVKLTPDTADGVPSLGDVFTIEDTLPTDMEFISNAAVVGVANNAYGSSNNGLVITENGNNVKFEYTVSQTLIDQLNNSNTKDILVFYATKLKDDVAANLYKSYETRKYTNTADVKYKDKDLGTVSATAEITPPVEDVIVKTVTDQPIFDANDPRIVYSDFTIRINSAKLDLVDGTKITAVDTLGENLILVGEPTITPNTGASYSTSGQTLTFTLDDETTYEIRYRVQIKYISKEKAENTSSERLDEMFGNSIKVGVSGQNEYKQLTRASSSSYSFDADYVYNEQNSSIVIKGKKSWKQDSTENVRPEKITLTLVAHHTPPNNGQEYDETTNYEFTPGANDEWTYEIKDLPTLENGTTITYSITELKADGYEVSYAGDNLNIEKPADSSVVEINITNTFTPITEEIGSLTVTKVWDGDDNNANDTRPADLKFVLADRSGNYSYEAAVDANNKATFTNIPLYTYSRNDDGTLKRTAREYTLTESSTDNDKLEDYQLEITGVTITDGYFTLTNVTEEDYSLTTPVEVTATNTYDKSLARTEATVVKVWDDNDNQDGLRPNELRVELSDGTTVTLNADNNWTAKVEALPKYDANGDEITYTWTEPGVAEYTKEGSVTNGTVTTITNKHVPATTTASIKKVWNDNNNQDGKRPGSITVKLFADGVEKDTAVLSDSNGWHKVFTDLPLKKDGTAIAYTWTEVSVEGYSSSASTTGTLTTLTNSYTPELTEATVIKVWDDATNQDGKRPAELKVTLSNGTEVTLNEQNGWTAKVENLPKYANGTEIVYTWTEAAVEGYQLTNTEKNGTTTILTNTHTPETVSISGAKTWDDGDNRDGKRPASITVNLNKNGNTINSKVVTANDGWTYSFDSLPKYENGTLINYTITEDTVSGYTTAINGYDITNTYEPEKITISGTKTWDDNNYTNVVHPEITVNLYADGDFVKSTTASEQTNWEYEFTDLYKYDNGTEITYSISEVLLSDFTTTYNGYDITNTYTPDVTSVQVIKKWEDDNNRDGKRPASITVKLLANGVEKETATLNADTGWTYTFTGLDKNNGNAPIEYTITEDSVTGYTTVINGYTITNAHTPELTEATVVKVWDDATNQDGKRPAELKVTLSNGTEVTLNEQNSWTAKVENLPKYANGTEIVYTWTEAAVEGYQLTNTEKNGTTTTLTNTHTPETTAVSGMKTWNDNNDAEGKRPASITVRLLANGREVASDTVNENDGWAYSFDNLPKYDGGTLIVYTITEDAVADYTTTINGFNITNTYTPVPDEKTEATIKKVWNDDNNADGKRPASIVVTLSNGTAVTLSATNNWTVTVPDLPKYDASGAEIRYTWSEPSMPEGYRLTSTVVNGTVTTLTNTYTKQTDTNNPLQPTPPNVPNVPDVPNVPNVPVRPINPFFPIRPDEDEPEEDVSSESGITDEADTIGNVDTTSYPYLAILLAITAGGIMIARRRQKK